MGETLSNVPGRGSRQISLRQIRLSPPVVLPLHCHRVHGRADFTKGGSVARTGAVSASHLSVRRSNRTALRAEGKGAGVVELFEEAARGIESPGAGTAGLPQQSQLPPRLHPWAHRGGLSGRSLVSLMHAGGVG